MELKKCPEMTRQGRTEYRGTSAAAFALSKHTRAGTSPAPPPGHTPARPEMPEDQRSRLKSELGYGIWKIK